MESVATSADNYYTRAESLSTCGHWTASDEDEEEEVIEVGDVATLLPNENVKQVDVCESGVAYETKLEQKQGVIEVESEEVTNVGIAEEIEVEYEEMSQAPEAQDVVVPPSNLPVYTNMLENFKTLIDKDIDKAKELLNNIDAIRAKQIKTPLPEPIEDDMEGKSQFETIRIRVSSHTFSSANASTSADTSSCVVRKSTRNGKKRIVLQADSCL